MARAAYCDSVTRGTIDTALLTQPAYINISWANNGAVDDHVRAGARVSTDTTFYGVTTYLYNATTGISPATRYDWPTTTASIPYIGGAAVDILYGPVLNCDTTYYVKAGVVYYLDAAEVTANAKASATRSVKMDAIAATSSTPAASAVTQSTATIEADYVPNTLESTCVVTLSYKKVTDAAWITAGIPDSGITGYDSHNISRALTGLTAGTQYVVALFITRTTNNATTHTSAAWGTFITSAAAPTITTDGATSVGDISATLNATLDSNSISTAVSFEWDVDSGAPYAQTTTPATIWSTDGNHGISDTITGLQSSTTYYYRAKAVYAGGTVYGSEQNFSTTADPAAQAGEQEMLPIQDFDRKYGVATTIFFVAPVDSATNANSFYTGAAVWAGAGESKVSKDGAAFADTASDPAQVGTQLYSLALSAAEMQCNEAYVILTNAGTSVRDIMLRVRTHLQLGSIDIDAATGTKANTSALKLRGYQAGHGLEAIGGASGQDINGVMSEHVMRTGLCQAGSAAGTVVLDASAHASNDYYNGAIVMMVSGTAVGQARLITDYAGASQTCNVNRNWTVTPADSDRYILMGGDDPWEQVVTAELTAAPSATAASFKQMLQFLYQRFRLKRTQTALAFTMYKSDDATSVCSAGVDDDGTTQTHEKMT